MKTLSPKHILCYTAFSAVMGIVLAVARAVISLSSLERGIELYAHNTAADDILHIVIAVCVVLLFSSMLLPLRESTHTDIRRTSPLTVFAATFTGFMILAYDLLLLINTAKDDWSAIAPLIGKPPVAGVTLPSAVFLLCLMLSALPAAVFFFKLASAGAAEKPSFPVFATFASVFFTLFALHVYFDTATAMNSPMHIMRILALIAFVLYAIHETRRILDIAIPRWYFAFAFTALFFGLVVVISDAVLYAKGIITLPDGYIGLAIQLAYLFYILSRLLSLCTAGPAAKVQEEKDASTH